MYSKHIPSCLVTWSRDVRPMYVTQSEQPEACKTESWDRTCSRYRVCQRCRNRNHKTTDFPCTLSPGATLTISTIKESSMRLKSHVVITSRAYSSSSGSVPVRGLEAMQCHLSPFWAARLHAAKLIPSSPSPCDTTDFLVFVCLYCVPQPCDQTTKTHHVPRQD